MIHYHDIIIFSFVLHFLIKVLVYFIGVYIVIFDDWMESPLKAGQKQIIVLA